MRDPEFQCLRIVGHLYEFRHAEDNLLAAAVRPRTGLCDPLREVARARLERDMNAVRLVAAVLYFLRSGEDER